MIDIRKLKELVKLMVANDLSEMDLRDTDEQVTIRRQGEQVITAMPHIAQVAPQATVVASGTVAQPPSNGVASDKPEEDVEIASPMVGTFYSSQDPNSPPFVSVGDTVDEDTTVCIVEAMKIFNEIKAQCKGKIIKVLVNSGDPVEFGQPIFLVKSE